MSKRTEEILKSMSLKEKIYHLEQITTANARTADKAFFERCCKTDFIDLYLQKFSYNDTP